MIPRWPVKLPPIEVDDWPSPLVAGDWYVSVTGEEFILKDGHWRPRDLSKPVPTLTPPPV